MFRNRISVVRGAKAASKPSTKKSSLGSTSEPGDRGDGPSSLPVEFASLQSGASDTASVGDESVAMEYAKPDEGICIDETASFLDDSGEIRENELRLAEEDDNDVTKDLDFSRTSPALFSLTSPKRARMMLEIQKSVERNGPNLVTPGSSATSRGSLVIASSSSFATPSVPATTPSVFRCIANETPQQREQHRTTPWSIRSSSQSKQAGTLKRQSITGAIDDLNEMTEELIDFIKNFEEKYTTAIN